MNIAPLVVVVIRNLDGKFFINHRRGDSETFPNLYGLGVDGPVEAGELPIDAAKRVLYEKTALDTDVKFLFNMPYEEDGTSYMISIFETLTGAETIANYIPEWRISDWMEMKEVDKLLLNNSLRPDMVQVYIKYIKECV